MTRLVQYVRQNAIAFAALFVALSGTAYAGATLAKNSVGSTQIRANAVGSSELRANSVKSSEIAAGQVGSSEVKNGSLTKNDFKSGELPQGPAGPAGPAGAAGAAGAQGPKGETGPTEKLAVRLRQLDSPGTGGTPLADNQSVNSSASGAAGTAIDWTIGQSGPTFDFGSFFDESRADLPLTNVPATSYIRIPKTGTYVLSAGVRFESNPDGIRSIGINGPLGAGFTTGGVRAQNSAPANAASATAVSVSTVERFTEGDGVYASVGQSSGVALKLDASQDQTHFAATYVGP